MKCPMCEMSFKGETCVTGDDAAPEDGDCSVCGHCGTIFLYDAGRPRLPTEAEADDLARDTNTMNTLSRMQAAIIFARTGIAPPKGIDAVSVVIQSVENN